MFHFGKKNKQLDVEKLLRMDDENKIVIEMDNYICNLCSFGDDLSKLTDAQKLFFYNQEFERGVNDEGFYGFFLNSSGKYATETIDSLKKIGANKTSNILQKAMAIFPDSKVPKDDKKREDLIEKLSERAEDVWSELEDKFYEYEDDLNNLNVKFIRDNIKSF